MLSRLDLRGAAADLGDVLAHAAADGSAVDAVREIISEVRERGDDAVRELTERFDGCRIGDLRIPPEELRGATITLSNFGMIGGRYANLVVVPPQVAIIGAGRAAQRVLAHRGQPAVRRALPLSLTFDHRVVTGGEAARFECLELP